MSVGLLGRKCGMTRIFREDGKTIPVSVIAVDETYISQVKTVATDGYNAIQIVTGTCKATHMNKSIAGHLAAAQVATGKKFLEFRLPNSDGSAWTIGSPLTVSMFQVGSKVDVTGDTKGKGFAGTIKRHNFSAQRTTHGNSRSHRVPGSIGQNQTPGRVFKGKKMCGHLGTTQVTIQSLEIIRIDEKRNALLVKGAIPGAPGGYVVIRPAVKIKTKAVDAA